MKIISFDNSRKGITKNAFLGFAFQFLIKLKGIIILPLIVYYLPKETLGEWRLISTTVSIILPIISLNVLDGSGMYFSSDTDTRSVRIKYISLLHLVLGLTFITTVFSLFFKSYFNLFNQYTLSLILFFISSVFLKLSIFLYQTYQKASKLLIINFIIEYGGALLTILLIRLEIKNIHTLITPIILLNFTTSLFLMPKIFKEIKYNYYFNVKFIKNILPISIPLIPVYITEWILSSVGIYFLQYYFSTNVVGSYSILLSIASLMLTLRATLQFFWFSTCSNMLRNNKMNEFNKILKEVIKIYIVFCLIALIIYGYFSKDLISIFTNKNYQTLSKPLFFTSLGYAFLVFSTIWNGILYSLGKSKRILKNYIYAAFSIILFSILLINKYEITGACISYMIGNIVLFISMYISTKGIGSNFTKKESITNTLLIFIACIISLSQFFEIDIVTNRIIGISILIISLFIIFGTKYIVPNIIFTMLKK